MKIGALRATITGGVVFLIPLTVLIIILGKLFDLMGAVAAPLSKWIPIEAVGGIAIANIVTALFIIVICYLAGLAASLGFARRFMKSLDDKLLTFVPRYAFVKGMTEGIGGDGAQETLKAVLVSFDDMSQIAFEVERNDAGLVTIYLPGSPDPWSGAVAHVQAERIRPIDAGFKTVIDVLRKAGVGGNAVLESL